MVCSILIIDCIVASKQKHGSLWKSYAYTMKSNGSYEFHDHLRTINNSHTCSKIFIEKGK